MDSKKGKTEKKNHLFHCEACNYFTSDKWKFSRHILTKKHKKIPQKNSLDLKKGEEEYVCEYCQKKFKSASAVIKHKKIHMTNDEILQNLLIKQQEQDKKLEKCIKILSNKKEITNNLTIQVFLNENCKDAMTLEKFIGTMKINFGDLMNTKEKGYIDGISNIIINNLKALKIEERPIHCTNSTLQNFHIKTDKWEDDDGKKVTQAISAVGKAQIHLLSEWLQQHPNWENNERETEEYMKLIQTLTNIEDLDKNNKILHNIATAVLLK